MYDFMAQDENGMSLAAFLPHILIHFHGILNDLFELFCILNFSIFMNIDHSAPS